MMWRGTVENLTDRAQAGIQQMIADRLQPGLRCRCVALHPVVRHRVMTQQPSPDRPLMTAAIPFPDRAAIIGLKFGMARRQRTQPEVGQQFPAADPHHGLVRGVLVHRNPATGNARQLEKVLGVEIVEAIPYDPRAAAAHQATELVYDFQKKRLGPPARAYAQLAEWLVAGGRP